MCAIWRTRRTIRIEVQVLDENRRVVAERKALRRVEAQSLAHFDLTTDEIEGVALWHPSHPHLYSVVCSLYKGRKLVDSEEVTFGFRWFEWTADKGFFLNGKHFFFRGRMYIRIMLDGETLSLRKPCAATYG